MVICSHTKLAYKITYKILDYFITICIWCFLCKGSILCNSKFFVKFKISLCEFSFCSWKSDSLKWVIDLQETHNSKTNVCFQNQRPFFISDIWQQRHGCGREQVCCVYLSLWTRTSLKAEVMMHWVNFNKVIHDFAKMHVYIIIITLVR